MPNPLIASMRRCVAAMCHALRVTPREFEAMTGFNGFLLDAAECECPLTLAAMAASHLIDRDKPVVVMIVCAGICDYLDDRFGAPQEDPQQARRLRDLKQLVDAGAPQKAYYDLFKAWHP